MQTKYFLFDETEGGEGDGGSTGGGSLGFLDNTFNSVGEKLLEGEDISSADGSEKKTAPEQGGEKDKGQEGEKKVERRPVPKSWKSEWHPKWDTLPDDVRDIIHTREEDFLNGTKGYEADRTYAKAVRDLFGPYKELLEAQGVQDPMKAIQFFLSAHGQLSNPDVKGRLNHFLKLAEVYNIDPPSLLAAIQSAQEGAKPDPAVQSLTQEVNTLKSRLGLEDQRRQKELEKAIDDEVTAFAKDPANSYFEELRADIAALLKGSDTMTLKEAYDRAVWGNPVTRAKENSRLQKEQEEKLRKEAEEKAAAKRKARGTNVRGQDSEKSPTDILGSMEDTMREKYREIQSRTE